MFSIKRLKFLVLQMSVTMQNLITVSLSIVGNLKKVRRSELSVAQKRNEAQVYPRMRMMKPLVERRKRGSQFDGASNDWDTTCTSKTTKIFCDTNVDARVEYYNSRGRRWATRRRRRRASERRRRRSSSNSIILLPNVSKLFTRVRHLILGWSSTRKTREWLLLRTWTWWTVQIHGFLPMDFSYSISSIISTSNLRTRIYGLMVRGFTFYNRRCHRHHYYHHHHHRRRHKPFSLPVLPPFPHDLFLALVLFFFPVVAIALCLNVTVIARHSYPPCMRYMLYATYSYAVPLVTLKQP